ncbi:2'-5' RNA ligase family protein [Rugosimonospora africana]|uniref:RNA 2',3'-cyclic phosphodiesterase n=1 Tax=Rugosimonospora africana TaxID=556532 RepID=A0A8J3VTF2_9ACTN|nr:2'-5' RNA ligase family protein [Rugosimonospora africana]GIH17606.1 RNA 2',3'-cyclic phosphodiesterase [Rugosimonospora africana]
MTLTSTGAAGHRLFIAVEPPPAALDHLAEFTAGLGFVQAGIRVTARHLWHVTLAFIGEVPEDLLPAAVTALDRAAAAVRPSPVSTRRSGMRTRPEPVAAEPTARLTGGGRFGRGRFTIVWAGIEGELGPLRRATTRALRRGRLPYDDKRYHPHLTLGRPGDRIPREVIAADLIALAGYRGPSWTIGGLVLYRSHLGPNPVYEPVHTASLAADPGPVDAAPG